MRSILTSLVAGIVIVAAAIALSPQEAEARYGSRGYGGYGDRTRVYRPYRPYRYDEYYRYPRTYYRPYIYIPPTVVPSPYGFRGMIGPRPVIINPGAYYRF